MQPDPNSLLNNLFMGDTINWDDPGLSNLLNQHINSTNLTTPQNSAPNPIVNSSSVSLPEAKPNSTNRPRVR